MKARKARLGHGVARADPGVCKSLLWFLPTITTPSGSPAPHPTPSSEGAPPFSELSFTAHFPVGGAAAMFAHCPRESLFAGTPSELQWVVPAALWALYSLPAHDDTPTLGDALALTHCIEVGAGVW